MRRAVAYELDRGAVARLAGGSRLARPTCQVLPPGIPGYQPYCPYTLRTAAGGIWSAPDPAKAANLAAASSSRPRSIAVGTFVELTHLARPVLSALARLGYRPTLRIVSPQATSFGNVDAVLLGWFKDYPAPSDFVEALFTCRQLGATNFSKFCNRSIDAQVERAAAGESGDLGTANALWAKIDRELVDAAPAAPLFTTQAATLLSTRVGNYQYSPQWGPLLDQLWVR
jgi:peptide/nickel transport system substrate-binding protein